MIDITVNQHLIDEDETKDLPKIEKIKGIAIHCISEHFTYEETTAYTKDALLLAIDKKFSSKNGFHYCIDAEDIVECVPDGKQANHIIGNKPTFISRVMYNDKPNESSIAIVMSIPKDQKYEDVEKKTVKFIADYLIKKELNPDCVMRTFDLDRSPSPLHLLEKEKWRGFIKLLQITYDAMKEKKDKYTDDELEKAAPTYTDSDVRKFYLENGKKAVDYSRKFEPDHRDIAAIAEAKTTSTSETKNMTTKNNTTFSYTVVENVPSSADHCNRAFDTLTAKATPSSLEVEPIYPDLAVPPGGTITILESLTKDVPIQSNNVPLSVEEFQNREQAFNVKNYMDAKKKVTGKPVNNNDPYPADDKIKELESHMPKVKIDEVDFKLHDCNHPGSIIGPEVAKNFAMVQDEIITLAKRSERRLVKLENVMATLMRNLFRTASRMQINCVYYGGQDVYGKYKCIRCLHNDRISDGQSMTLDQCLSCTRYEPVLGQVYAILDETGTNVAQVLDDIQMSYMSMEEYAALTRTEEVHTERKIADMSFKNEVVPDSFSKIFPEGFKMNWSPTPLEAQRASIAEYKAEGIVAVKPEIKKDNEPSPKDEFKTAVSAEEEYETVKYDSEDYNFEGFGEEDLTGIGSGFGFGTGAQIRNKIVEYAQNAYKLCQDSKAGYSQANRYAHLENAINGISYWDCSSLAEKAYATAGITGIGSTTYTEYPFCIPKTGGIVLNADEDSKALPGDMVFFTDQQPHPKTQEELSNADVNSIGHVGIYIGNGEYIHASTDDAPLTQQIKKSPIKNWDKRFFAFGRPKALVEADKAAVEGAVYNGDVPIPNLNYSGLTPAKKKWSQTMAQICIKASLKYPQLFASVAIIQGAMESGWGENTVGNNYFGIKADPSWKGEVVNAGTSEQNALGQSYNISANFRKYNNPEESAYDRYKFLVDNSRYKEHGVFSAKTPEEQIRAIHKAGYATDVNYSDMIISEILFRNAKDADRVVEELRKKMAEEKAASENKTE